jgi:hypothetical protein
MIDSWRGAICAAGLFLFGACGLADGLTPQMGDTTALADCSSFEATGAALGCASFNQMIKAHDKELLDLIPDSDDYKKKTHVCFVPGEDTFILVSFDIPTDKWRWRKDPRLNASVARTEIRYKKYSDGVLSSSRVGFLDWTAYSESDKNPDQLSGFSPPAPKSNPILTEASVDPSEVSISFSYETLAGKTARYSLQIRRATLRFAEVIDVEKQRITATGKCLEYSTDVPRVVDPHDPHGVLPEQ